MHRRWWRKRGGVKKKEGNLGTNWMSPGASFSVSFVATVISIPFAAFDLYFIPSRYMEWMSSTILPCSWLYYELSCLYIKGGGDEGQNDLILYVSLLWPSRLSSTIIFRVGIGAFTRPKDNILDRLSTHSTWGIDLSTRLLCPLYDNLIK